MAFDETKYQEALDYLYKFVDYSLTRQDQLVAAKFDLRRMVDLMELLGNPQKKYPIIHVAGTKGKGSTAAMIASVLLSAGYKTGLYTSPHLQDYIERIQINQKSITHQELIDLVEEIKPEVEKTQGLTTFEITTAIGFKAFADADVDIAVIEVGLGGRLDATNIITPLVSVITSLSYDHMAVLGDTLAQIATEKAGIIKQCRPVVLAPQEEAARKVVEKIAGERNAPITIVGQDYFFSPVSHSLEGQSLIVWSKEDQPLMDILIDSPKKTNWKPTQLNLSLLGYHQVQNAATAYAVLQVAKEQGIKVSDKAIQQGFETVEWPGRFDVLSKQPLLIVDSAHNQDSALKLRLAMDDYLDGKSIVLIFGASEDKDIKGMFTQLIPRVKIIIATQSTHPRAMPAKKLVELAHQFGRPAIATSDITIALEKALKLVKKDDAIVVAGSIFVAAAAREEWSKLKSAPNKLKFT